ncbi:restriction endonuclease subunit S [Flavobacterium coralii]|uniref:restriction endonuclease subunit S n=1 Tax=Flavobacterium coralii TaxID=2838017 RepID=UPI000C3C12AA|nr:hypothetical protein [Flavobacterium sp.]|tara:strand:- start:10718 stop:11866 length:1149 start_codon:yes stop_codon:yes gene_type:complete
MTKLKIDKTNWKLTKFGDVVYEPKETVKDVVTENIQHVVGLEHIDTDDIHLRRSASIQESTTFTKKFAKGDVLFGRRRAYLRKAAQAEFEGICSGDITVFRAKPALSVRLLPFVVNNDAFFDYAITHSAGGLSPRVRFRDLANYEFLLPPPEEQEKLVELLWAMDEVIESQELTLEKLNSYYASLVDDLFTSENKSWQYKTLSQVANINVKALKANTNDNYEFQYLDIASIIEPKVIGKLTSYMFSEAPSRARRVVSNNSIVLSLVRPYLKAFVYVTNAENLIASTGTAVVDVKNGYNTRFIFHQFFSKRFSTFCENLMTGTNYPAITANDLKMFKICIPHKIDTQNKYADKLDSIENSIFLCKESIITSKALQKSLINQIF